MTNDNPDVTGALCRAMEALQDRPILFKYVLDEVGIARRSAVVRCFIDALTRGGSQFYIYLFYNPQTQFFTFITIEVFTATNK